MTASFSAPRLPVHRSVLRFVHDRNPFYLLSALCMFIGFRIVLGALNSAPGDWRTLLGLIVTLQFYEAAMITLALLLIVKRGLLRDGWILLGVEALFLVDLTNLNAELFTAMPRLGCVISGICFSLALVKILVVVRVLGLDLKPRTAIYIAAQLAFLLGLPGLFRLMQSPMSSISPMQIYAVWWITGLLIVAGAVLVRPSLLHEASPMAALPWRLYVLIPLISLLVHLTSENRVYWVHFHLANIAPVLLGLVVALNRSKWRHQQATLQWSIGLVAAAVVLSIVPEMNQAELSGRLFGIAVSPLRLSLIGSGATLMYLAILHRSIAAVVALSVCAILAVMGVTVDQIEEQCMDAVRWVGTTLMRLVPDTILQWGYVAIASAFLLLGIGAVVSLHRSGPPLGEDEVVA
jgi:hypothetical protein